MRGVNSNVSLTAVQLFKTLNISPSFFIVPCTKMNSQGITDLRGRAGTVNLLRGADEEEVLSPAPAGQSPANSPEPLYSLILWSFSILCKMRVHQETKELGAVTHDTSCCPVVLYPHSSNLLCGDHLPGCVEGQNTDFAALAASTGCRPQSAANASVFGENSRCLWRGTQLGRVVVCECGLIATQQPLTDDMVPTSHHLSSQDQGLGRKTEPGANTRAVTDSESEISSWSRPTLTFLLTARAGRG